MRWAPLGLASWQTHSESARNVRWLLQEVYRTGLSACSRRKSRKTKGFEEGTGDKGAGETAKMAQGKHWRVNSAPALPPSRRDLAQSDIGVSLRRFSVVPRGMDDCRRPNLRMG